MKPIRNRTVSGPNIRWQDDVNKMKATNLNVTKDRRAGTIIIEKARTFTFEVVLP